MMKKLLSIILAASICNFSLVCLLPSNCYSKISYSENEKFMEDYDKSSKKVAELQESFFKRNKWKLIGAGLVGGIVAGVIIIGTAGVGTGPAIAAGAGSSNVLAAGAGATGVAAAAATTGLPVSAIELNDYTLDKGVKLTPELQNKIMSEIRANKYRIMQEANDKDDAMRIMNEIARTVISAN